MSNLSDTESYTFVDHILSRAVLGLSRLVGVKNITKPFWNRWRASLISDEMIINFLNRINSINEWPQKAYEIIQEEQEKYNKLSGGLSKEEKIKELRQLSFFAHMAQWGSMSINELKVTLYKASRDYYIESETLAHGDKFKRVKVPFKGQTLWGNLHLPKKVAPPYPLVVVTHGMDDSKEEHLQTMNSLQEGGLAVFCMDGPGQAEALFLDNITWGGDYHEATSRAITVLCENYNCDPENVGVLGISWGGMWAYKVAAIDARVGGIYDLGGPVGVDGFKQLPFFLKTKYCQVLGIKDPKTLPEASQMFTLHEGSVLQNVKCPVKIVHGGKDPLVATEEKIWLKKKLDELHPGIGHDLKIYPKGDHCCTQYSKEGREDSVNFFHTVLSQKTLVKN